MAILYTRKEGFPFCGTFCIMDQRVHMQRKLKQICGGLEKSIVQIKNVYKDKVLHVRREAG